MYLFIFLSLMLVILSSVRGFSDYPEECEPHQMPCYDNAQCIDESKWCDGIADCADDSDELNCNPKIILGSRKNTDENVTTKLPPSLKSSLEEYLVASNSTSVKNVSAKFEAVLSDSDYVPQTKSIIKARNWLLSQRKGYNWGDETHRAIIALQLSKSSIPTSDVKEELLMSQQLHLQILLSITRTESEISLGELALYINALQASCYNPRHFYRFDLLDILRKMVDKEHVSRRFVVPLVYLTLCLNNNTTNSDTIKFEKLIANKSGLSKRIDFQALAVLASACMASKHPSNVRDIHIFNAAQNELSITLQKGLPENVYELALAVQALNEAVVDSEGKLREKALKYILKQQKEDGSFGDILATYYVLPILNGESLLALNRSCNETYSAGDLIPTRVRRTTNHREYITVKYSLYYGNPVEWSLSLQLRVVQGTTFYEIMTLAQENNPSFRFIMDNRSNFSIYSIGVAPRDAEKGLYWELYTAPQNCSKAGNIPSGAKLPNQNIKTLVPKDEDNFFFWYKPM